MGGTQGAGSTADRWCARVSEALRDRRPRLERSVTLGVASWVLGVTGNKGGRPIATEDRG